MEIGMRLVAALFLFVSVSGSIVMGALNEEIYLQNEGSFSVVVALSAFFFLISW